MAGADYNGGTAVKDVQVPAIGGTEGRNDLVPEARTAPIVETAHLNDARAEGVSYPENPGTGGPEGSGFPPGTGMTDNTPGDTIN